MSNPYDGHDPLGHRPTSEWPGYGSAPPPAPYGGHPSYGAGEGPRSTDGISIAAFVCSLTCCAAPVGIGLGVAGIVRTKGGLRSGRWAAVSGLVIGVVLTVAMIAFFVFAGVMGSRTLWEDDARVGQCLDLDFLGDEIKAECADPHTGEVIWVGEFDEQLVERFDTLGNDDFCGGLPRLEPHYRAALESSEYQAQISIDAFDEDEPDDGDHFYCYLERTDDEAIEGRIPAEDDPGSATGV